MISAEEIEIKKFKSSQDQSFLEFFNKDNRGEDFIRRYGFGVFIIYILSFAL